MITKTFMLLSKTIFHWVYFFKKCGEEKEEKESCGEQKLWKRKRKNFAYSPES